MFGYRAVDVCDDDQDYDDFEDGLCDPPGGGLINGITEVDSFGFVVPFTDLDRKLFIGNTAYLYQDWMLAWYTECGWCQERIQNREPELLYNPAPMLGEDEIAFIDSVDGEGGKVFKSMNVDWATIYSADPAFIEPATNEDTLKIFIEYKWSTAADIDWSYKPGAGFYQTWPLPENMAYNNEAYKTAAMGGFPLGDLNWWPEQLPAWEAQRDVEWDSINIKLEGGASSIREIPGVAPADYVLKQNFPNPFNPTTQIEYSIPTTGYVTLKVYNLLGEEVATLFEGNQKAGNYIATFNGSKHSSGVYLYRLEAANFSEARKFTLLK
jgi:hypothetical protein